jgi:dCMP deaminase
MIDALTTGIYRNDYSKCTLDLKHAIAFHLRLNELISSMDNKSKEAIEVINELELTETNLIFIQETFATATDLKDGFKTLNKIFLDYEIKYKLTQTDFFDLLFTVKTKYSPRLEKNYTFWLFFISRLELNSYFMAIAKIAAERSTCRRGNVGCVVVDSNKRIVSTGYNGVPPGSPHEPHKHTREECRAIHAEINALEYVANKDLTDATLYITRAPCHECYHALMCRGIKTVYYAVKHSTTYDVTMQAIKDGVQLIYWPNILYEEVL